MQTQPTPSARPQALVVEDDPLYATLYRETLVSMVPNIEVMVAQNGYLITQLEDLFHFVGDIHNAAAAVFKLTDNGKKVINLFFRQ